jgi:hypothetical protein
MMSCRRSSGRRSRTLEVDIFDAQFETLQKAQASAIEDRDHQPGSAVQLGEDCADFVASQNDGDTNRAFCVDEILEIPERFLQYVFVEKQQSAEGLILSGGAHASDHRQMREERRDLDGTHVVGMALAVKEDESADPADVRLFGPPAVVSGPQFDTHAIEEFRGGLTCGVAHGRLLWVLCTTPLQEASDVPTGRIGFQGDLRVETGVWSGLVCTFRHLVADGSDPELRSRGLAGDVWPTCDARAREQASPRSHERLESS